MAFDARRGRVVVWGGDAGANNLQTWEYDGTRWVIRRNELDADQTDRNGCGATTFLEPRSPVFGSDPSQAPDFTRNAAGAEGAMAYDDAREVVIWRTEHALNLRLDVGIRRMYMGWPHHGERPSTKRTA
ncbi:MAG: hypothetical protein AAFY60_07745 [Myxococcota bacterium]